MPADHYESAYGSCITTLTIEYESRRSTVGENTLRPFWCPACGRTHNYRKVAEAEATETHRLENAEPAETPDTNPEEDGPDPTDPGGSADESEAREDGDDADSKTVETPPVSPDDLTVAELRSALGDDSYDWNAAALRGLYEAEVNGEARDTALHAITRSLKQAEADEEGEE